VWLGEAYSVYSLTKSGYNCSMAEPCLLMQYNVAWRSLPMHYIVAWHSLFKQYSLALPERALHCSLAKPTHSLPRGQSLQHSTIHSIEASTPNACYMCNYFISAHFSYMHSSLLLLSLTLKLLVRNLKTLISVLHSESIYEISRVELCMKNV